MADESSDQSATKTISFTPSETKILLSIMHRMKGDLVFDADLVAADCGLKDAKTAKTRWWQIKKAKLTGNGASPIGGIDKSSPNKKTAAKPKSATATKGKGGRKSEAAKAAEAAEVAAEEDGDPDDCDDQDHEKLVKQEQLANSDEEY